MSKLRMSPEIASCVDACSPDPQTGADLKARLRTALGLQTIWQREPRWEGHAYLDALDDPLVRRALGAFTAERQRELAESVVGLLAKRPSAIIHVDAAPIDLAACAKKATAPNLFLGGQQLAPTGERTQPAARPPSTIHLDVGTTTALRRWIDTQYLPQDDWFDAVFQKDDGKIRTLTFRARYVSVHDAAERLDRLAPRLKDAGEDALLRTLGSRGRPALVMRSLTSAVLRAWFRHQVVHQGDIARAKARVVAEQDRADPDVKAGIELALREVMA